MGPRRCNRLLRADCSRRRVGRGGLCVSISRRCGCSTRFTITAAIPSIRSWQPARFLPHVNSTPPHMLAALIGQRAGGTTLTALRLNERSARLSYGLTGLRAAPRSRCFPCLASLDPGVSGLRLAFCIVCRRRAHGLIRAELIRPPSGRDPSSKRAAPASSCRHIQHDPLTGRDANAAACAHR